MNNLIGLCGAARSGKDTFFDFAEKILKESKMKCRRFAFADELKMDLNPFLMQKFCISAWTTDEDEKALIRPIMVAYGEAMRNQSKGAYWINKIKPKIKKNTEQGNVSVITDVRYENEISFINSMGSSRCVYIERLGVDPANKEEEQNDPDLRKGSYDLLKWRTFGDQEIYKCGPIVESCLKRLEVL